MLAVKPALARCVASLRGAGYTAELDPELLTPPGVWVQPRGVSEFTLAGGGTLTCWLYLIVPNVDVDTALTLLDDLLAGLDDLELVLADDDPPIDLSAAVVLPSNPTTPLPAYRVAVDLEL